MRYKHTGALLWLALSLHLSACNGRIEQTQKDTPRQDMMSKDMSQDDMSRDMHTDQSLSDMDRATGDVFTRLKPSCAGCHGAGTSWPGFANYAAFENLLVRNTQWVVPGKPDESALLPMLDGKGAGALVQMPIGELSFAQLEQEGKTQITMNELREWIASLKTQAPTKNTTARSIRLKRAEQIVNTLYDHLGLTPDDFFTYNATTHYYTGNNEAIYPVLSPDQLPNFVSSQYAYRYPKAFTRWKSLGGAVHIEKEPGRNTPTIAAAQNIIQISQSWCRVAVKKQNNKAILHKVTISDTSAQAAPAIKENIAYLHLRMLGEVASSERVDAIFNDIFTYYEKRDGGTETAWTAVCASLIRDPLWLTY